MMGAATTSTPGATMSEQAIASFDITSWDEQPYDEREGVKLSRTRVGKAFRGDIEGESEAELLMAIAGEDSAAYVGVERVEGRVNGRQGSFVYLHTATAAGGRQEGSWTVVDGSGTGELAGISGQVRIDNLPDGGHVFTLDYRLS
jgi:Protein of unknown function (DUF3224)